MKSKLTCLRVLIILLTPCTFFFFSCRKEIKPELQKPVATLPEQAYPKIQGEILEVAYGSKTIHVEKKGNHYVWLGDIAFDQSTFDSLKARKTNSQRTFNNDATHLWPLGIVYYTIASGFSQAELTMINNAIQDFTNNTALTFTQRTSQTNYILITPGSTGSGLYSDYVGMKGGQQIINLENGGFLTGHVVHEIGHAIGFYHEQSRTDRDNAIIVNYNNVYPHTSQNIYQFETYADHSISGYSSQPGSQISSFDFNSVMLYSSFDFSDFIHPTMTKLDNSIFTAQRTGLSSGDIETIAYMYGPPFVRIEYLVTVNDTYATYGEDFEHQEGHFYLNLYANSACTVSYTAPVDKSIDVRLVENISGSITNWDYTVTIPAGYNQITLSQDVVTREYHAVYGTPVQYDTRIYELHNSLSFGRPYYVR